MERNTLIGAVVLLVFAGALYYFAGAPALVRAPGVGTELSGGTYEERAQYYDITAEYATTTPLTGSANAAAVATMKQFVSDSIAQFKKDGNFDNLTQKDVTMMGFDQGRKESLHIVYLETVAPHTISFVYTTYMDTLGAHGNTFFKTFTFDTTTGKELALADLFVPGSDYLGALSKIARAKLPDIIGSLSDDGMLENGTAPEDKNFQNFFIGGDMLGILFAPYQVAAYAAGPQTLPIPLADLKDLLKPEYQ